MSILSPWYCPHGFHENDAHLCPDCNKTETIEIDPTELEPGDVVMRISDHEISGCHCDVRVTVERKR